MNFRLDPRGDLAGGRRWIDKPVPMGNKSRVVWKMCRNQDRTTTIQLHFLLLNNQENRLQK